MKAAGDTRRLLDNVDELPAWQRALYRSTEDEIAEETWMAELPVHGTQSQELTEQWLAETAALERDHPDLLKTLQKPGDNL